MLCYIKRYYYIEGGGCPPGIRFGRGKWGRSYERWEAVGTARFGFTLEEFVKSSSAYASRARGVQYFNFGCAKNVRGVTCFDVACAKKPRGVAISCLEVPKN